MDLNKKIAELMNGGPLETKLQTFKQMIKKGDLKKVPIEDIVNFSPILKRLMDLYKETTDAPDEFLATSGLVMISTVLGNQTYIMYGSAKIYPHLWVVLVGDSSYYRKTTALNLTTNAVASMKFPAQWADHRLESSNGEGQVGEPVLQVIRSGEQLLAPNGFSLALLLEELQERPSMLMAHSEFASLLTEIEKTYNLGAKEALTDMYDSGRHVKFNKTIKAENKGKPIIINETAIAIYSASTRHWLQDHIKPSDIGSGFMARFLFVPANKKTRSHGWPKTMDETTYNIIKSEIASLRRSVKGEFDVSAVKPFYELWYLDLMKRAQQEEDISEKIGFDSRLSIYALKFSIILHASKYGNTILTLDSLVHGIQLAEYFRGKTKELFQTTFLSKFEKNVRRVAEYIYRNDHAITNRKLQQRAGSYGIRAMEFKEILEILEDEGDVHWDHEGKATISYASKFLKGVIKR